MAYAKKKDDIIKKRTPEELRQLLKTGTAKEIRDYYNAHLKSQGIDRGKVRVGKRKKEGAWSVESPINIKRRYVTEKVKTKKAKRDSYKGLPLKRRK